MNIDEIEDHLQSLWNKRQCKIVKGEEVISYPTKRSTKLIVPHVSWEQDSGTGSLNNDHWAYNVHYSFRSALDLSYDTRIKTQTFKNEITGENEKNTTPYQIWTQGYKIHFKEGDLLTSNNGYPSIQVQNSQPISWDDKNKIMNLGMVEFEPFDDMKFGHIGDITTVNQMEFLLLLIFGEI